NQSNPLPITQDAEEINRQLTHLLAKIKALSSLIEVSIIINSTLDLDTLIGLVMEKAQSVMNAEASSVMLINEQKNVLECALALGEVGDQVKRKMHLKMGEGIAGWVAVHGEPQIIPDARKDPRFFAKIDQQTGFQTRSILAAPLKVKGKIIGVAEVINRRDGKAFDKDDLELFCTFCRQVALAIDNARMHKLALEKQKLEQQLEAAKFIQQSFMPDRFPTSPEGLFEVAAKSIPATAVGGDFYDFIEFNDHLIGVAQGDVCGKGVPAALFMARMISDFRMFTQTHKNPAEVMKMMNNILFERSRRGMFLTFIYGILNTQNGRFTYCNAGHLPLIHIQTHQNKLEVLEKKTKGIPLGILQNYDYHQATVQLHPGDYLLMVTDGVIEAKNKRDEEYTLQKLLRLLIKPFSSVEDLIKCLIHDVQKFSKGVAQHDDVTVSVIRWNGKQTESVN
ncbi:MAG: GAF domain-containing protein, partial [Calditrichaeota bacterium]